jgi:hypothetical protein
MYKRAIDRFAPHETNIAVTGLHGKARNRIGRKSWPVTVQLYVAEPVGIALTALDHLHPEDARIKVIRPLPIGDMDDAMIELDAGLYGQESAPFAHQTPLLAGPIAFFLGLAFVVHLLALCERDLDLRAAARIEI